MKYLITESQYRKLLLEDSPNPYVGKKSTEGNFTITKFTTNNDSKSPLKLYPSNRYPIHIILRNRNVEQKEIIIEAVQFSDENRVSDLSYTQKPIPYSQGGQIYFNLIPSNNTSSEAFGNLSIDIVCFVLRKNVRDYLTLNYTYTVFPSEKRYEGCKSIFDQNALKRATDWYRNWLSNQATKNKFAKIFNYDTKTVEKHFENYLKILDQITMDYTFSNLQNGAWVREKVLQKLGLQTGGFDVPITINCRISSNRTKSDVQRTLIHEIQHILSSYHKFHPYIHNVWSVFGGEFESLLSKGEDVSEEDVKNLLKKEGFDDASAKELAETYAWRYKNDYEHLQRQEEATSALFEIRHALKLQPGQEITKQILIQNATKDSVEWFLNLWIFSGKSLDEFLKKQNTIALNQTKTSSDTGIA